MAKGRGSESKKHVGCLHPQLDERNTGERGTLTPFHAMRIAPNLVRQAKGAKRHLQTAQNVRHELLWF